LKTPGLSGALLAQYVFVPYIVANSPLLHHACREAIAW